MTRVVVKEGRVIFASVKDDENPVELTQGHMSAVVGRRLPEPPELVDSEYVLGWLNGRFVFKKSPLAEIASELGRTYDVKIELAHPDMSSLTMTADFENAPIEEILSSICLTLKLRYTFESDKYILTYEK
jgi:transmembrane sensor